MEYNCDYRRYTSANYSQHTGKKSKFYSDPQNAVQQFRSSCSGAMSLVVLKVLSIDGNGYLLADTVCTKDWDTEYYPEYIIDLI
ncbi:hypothetical protein C0J52_23773 [Blattella germanica]|nr:hypothetical protein C0J52_23773 [Blattella germanica]